MSRPPDLAAAVSLRRNASWSRTSTRSSGYGTGTGRDGTEPGVWCDGTGPGGHYHGCRVIASPRGKSTLIPITQPIQLSEWESELINTHYNTMRWPLVRSLPLYRLERCMGALLVACCCGVVGNDEWSSWDVEFEMHDDTSISTSPHVLL